MPGHAHDAAAEPPHGADELPPLHLLSLAADEPASWNSLPVELKQQVVDEVLNAYDAECGFGEGHSPVRAAVGWFARKDAREAELSTELSKAEELKRLGRVNREWRALSNPLLWRRLALRMANKSQLLRLERMFPTNASHVRYFNLGMDAFWQFGQPPTCYDPARNAVAFRLLKQCKQLEEVVLLQSTQNDEPISACEFRNLRTVTFFPSNFSLHAFRFVLRHPQLKSLALVRYGLPLDLDPAPLGDYVARFSRLEHLRVSGPGFVSDSFLQRAMAIKAPLVSLELVSTESTVSFDALDAFISKFASTLEALQINLLSADPEEWPDPNGPSLRFPRLTALAIGSTFEPSLFLRLLSPTTPLRLFCLELCPFLQGEPEPLLVFLRAHRSTLKLVHLSREALYGNDDWDNNYEEAELDPSDVKAIADCCDELEVELSVGGAYIGEEDLYADYGEHGRPDAGIKVWSWSSGPMDG